MYGSINIILLPLVQAIDSSSSFKGSRRPIPLLRTHTVVRAIGVSHTACKDDFGKIFDLTAGMYFNFLYHLVYVNELAVGAGFVLVV